jgi:thioredoxin-related protein
MNIGPGGKLYGWVLWVSLLPGLVAAADAPGTYYGARQTVYPAWFKESFLDFAEDIAEARRAGKRVMVLFHQDGCPYCNALVERNLSQRDIEQTLRKNFDVIAINLWGDREITNVAGHTFTEKTFAQGLKVQFTPTLLFFNEDGQIVLRLNGYLPPDRFKSALDYVAQHKEGEIRYQDYLAAHRSEIPGGELNPEDFFLRPPYDLTRTAQVSRPVAVFFEQRDCPDCDVLHTKVLPDPATRDIIRQFDNVQLDIWSSTPVTTPEGKTTTASEWARELEIRYAPTIVLFNGQGDEVIRAEAALRVFHTQGLFAYVLSDSYKTEPEFQRYLSARADHFIEQGDDIDIYRYADQESGQH